MKLGDYCAVNIDTYSKNEEWPAIHYLDTSSVTEGEFDKSQILIPGKDKIPSRARRKVQVGDILFSTVRPNQRHYGIIKGDTDTKSLLVSTGFAVLSVDRTVADPNFVYYYLTQDVITESLQSIAEQSTSAYPSIKSSDLENLDVYFPGLEAQRKISSVLKSIDGKISLNKKVNDNLQQQAQAIYFSMFIDNADPAWQRGHLSDLVIVRYGKDHKKLANGIYPVYGSGGIMRHVERPLYDKESVLIPRKGTLNNVMYVNQPFWSVDTMFYTEMRLPNVAKFVYHFVKAKDLASMNAGSAVPSMTTDILNAMEVAIPPASVLEEFESLVAPMYRAMQENDAQSKKLADLRDTLLPKLISGEIDVSGIQL